MNKSNTPRRWLVPMLLIALSGLAVPVAEAWNAVATTQNFRGSRTINQGPRQALLVADGIYTTAGFIFNNNGAPMDLAIRNNCTGTWSAITIKCNANAYGNNLSQTCPSTMISTQGNLQATTTWNGGFGSLRLAVTDAA